MQLSLLILTAGLFAGCVGTPTFEPKIFVAEGLNADGSLVKNYQRGLRYAIDYFGSYGPYYVYLLGPDRESSVREIFRHRAMTRVDQCLCGGSTKTS